MLGPLKLKLLAGALSLVGAAAASWWVTREVYVGRIAGLQRDYANAQAAAVEAAADQQERAHAVALAAALADAAAQERIVTRTLTITKEVPRYVKDTAGCITLGLVRVLDAAVHGRDLAELSLAPGEFDETCATVAATALAESIVRNYGICHANAQQLSGLQAWVRSVEGDIN
jgi:hypothetical protein